MRSFTIITSTPQLLANFLEARGIIKQETDTITGQTHYVGVLPGMEWIEVPNPIEINGVPDTRHVYLVKFSHDSEADKAPNFAQWFEDNTTKITAPASYTIRGAPAGDAWKVNGQNVWLAKADDRFGVWQ